LLAAVAHPSLPERIRRLRQQRAAARFSIATSLGLWIAGFAALAVLLGGGLLTFR